MHQPTFVAPCSFDLPVEVYAVPCATREPFPPADCLWLPERAWNRRLGAALRKLGCRAAGWRPGAGCRDERERLLCELPACCPLETLYKPYSARQQRFFPRPIWLRCEERGVALLEHRLTLVLWGRKAVRARELAFAALASIARVAATRLLFGGTLDGAARILPGADGRPAGESVGLEIELVTPFTTESLRKLERPRAAHPLDLILCAAARELAAWNLEDSDALSHALESVDRILDVSEEAARAAAESVTVDSAAIALADMGRFSSTGNRGRYRLRGLMGSLRVVGAIEVLRPWLAAAVVGGAGRRRLDGLGQIEVREALRPLSVASREPAGPSLA